MSDFLFSRTPIEQGLLSEHISHIHKEEGPGITEFHGNWGSLAVSGNLYQGFEAYEDEQYIIVVIGGPVLCFKSNQFLAETDPSAGTRAIYKRWKQGRLQWDEDLSGPFVFLAINKRDMRLTCVTDLMSFIPVYKYQEGGGLFLGTHTDALANACGQETAIDSASEVDFVLFGAVTYPYTSYEALRQLPPAGVHSLEGKTGNPVLETEAYWRPEEVNSYTSRDQAGRELREALRNYIAAVTEGMDQCAQFLSGGEDSRVLAALLPKRLQRDAFIFLDHKNREWEIAQKAAKAYDVNLHLVARSKTNYLEILSACAPLVGSGSSYTNAHTYGFHKSCGLREYPAVFGGLLSDALLKGSHLPKKARHPHSLFPDRKDLDYTRVAPVQSELFTEEVLREVSRRHGKHLEFVRQTRSESAEEWFDLWPSSMNSNISNIHVNRRLFRSYEPFTSKEVVKISAAVPQAWKLNRRLFHKMAQPLLRNSRWLLHGDGRLPYLPWYLNRPTLLGVRLLRKIGKNLNPGPAHQSSWADYKRLHQSEEWFETIKSYETGFNLLEQVNREKEMLEVYEGLKELQKMRLLQVSFKRSGGFRIPGKGPDLLEEKRA